MQSQPLQVSPPPVAVPRAVRCLGLGTLHAPVLESLPPPSRERSKSPDVDEQSGYPTIPAAPRKDQYHDISESETPDNYDSPAPEKLFRNGQLMFHKSYEGPEPISYVDTALYEGGRNDWYEAYTEVDLLWARRLDLVLRRHNIPRWATSAQARWR
jgi:hypothetical protein